MQIEDDPDLNSPRPGAKAAVKHVFATINAPPSPARSQPYAAPPSGSASRPVPAEYGAAWKVCGGDTASSRYWR